MLFRSGHWVEDANAGGGVYASPGSEGFYPWMNPDKQLYGLISRNGSEAEGAGKAIRSVVCGRKIRTAWQTGVAQ